MSKFFKLCFSVFIPILVIGIFLFTVNYFYSTKNTKQADAASVTRYLGGYAWSSNIGWLDLSKVVINSDDTLTGFGWSSNIGWVKFGGLSGFPSGAGTTATNAKISGNSISGWARACAGMNNGSSDQTTPNDTCSGTSRTDGWDGWISLSGTGYGVSNTATAGPVANSTKLSGFAWGSDVLGWVDWSNGYLVNNAPVDCAVTNSCPPGGPVTFPGGTNPPTVNVNVCSIEVNWTPLSSSFVTKYRIDRSDGFSTDLAGNASFFSDEISPSGSAAVDTSYTYTITPYNGAVAGVPATTATSAKIPPGCVPKINPPEVGSFVASPTSVPLDGKCSLVWSGIKNIDTSTNGACVITGPSGYSYSIPKGVNQGSTSTQPIKATSNYTLTCTNESGGSDTLPAKCALRGGYGDF